MSFFKKYYRPGMISLIGIPFLLFYLFYFRKIEYFIGFNMPAKVNTSKINTSDIDKVEGLLNVNLKPLPPPPLPPPSFDPNFKKFQNKLKVNLNNKIKLDSIIKKYAIYNSDSMAYNPLYEAFHKNLIIEFNNNTTYQQFINVLDACNKNNLHFYALLLESDSFFISFGYGQTCGN